MGILNTAVRNLKKMNRCEPGEATRQIFLEGLRALNITASRAAGKPIEQLTYAELKQELAIASILGVDIENPENRWFR